MSLPSLTTKYRAEAPSSCPFHSAARAVCGQAIRVTDWPQTALQEAVRLLFRPERLHDVHACGAHGGKNRRDERRRQQKHGGNGDRGHAGVLHVFEIARGETQEREASQETGAYANGCHRRALTNHIH